MLSTESLPRTRALPPHGWLGLALVGTCWSLNWGLDGLRTHALFFPLWLGYVLSVDGLCLRRNGTSALHRSPRRFLALFAISVPLWWLFELLNLRLGNWEYAGREHFSDLEYSLLASLSFSTVVPAILETSEWLRGTRWIRGLPPGPRLPATPRVRRLCAVLGAAALAATLIWPRYCFPLVWVGPVLLIEALNLRLGRRALTCDLARGDWRPWAALWAGGLVCGFFWELWNFWSYPKWVYHVPWVGFLEVFEMPLLGYLGYLPFAMLLYQLAHLLLPRGEWLRP